MALKKSSAQMVADARARIEEIETADLIAMVDDPSVPRGMLEFWVDPDSPYFKDIFAEDRKFVFHCASGWRSAISVDTLNDMGFKAAHLKNGFSEWVKMGGPVESKG